VGFLAAVAGLLASSYPLFVIVAVAIAAATLLDWWQRAYALTLILMLSATSTLDTLVAIASFGRYAAVALLVAVTWLTTRRVEPAYNSKLHKRMIGALWVTAGIAALSILWSTDRLQCALQVVALIMLISLVQLLSTRRWTDRAVMVQDFCVVSAILTVAFVGCLAAIPLDLPNTVAFGGTADTVGRFQGIFNNPNMLALLTAIAIPLGCGLIKEGNRLLGIAGVLSAAAALMLTESRTAIIATVVAIGWLFLRAGALSAARFAYTTSIVGATLLALSYNPFGTALSRFGELEGGDALNTRGIAWSATIDLVRQDPLGYGWQEGRQLFESLHGTVDFTFARPYVHNSYLQLLLELGVLGLLPLLYLAFGFVLLATNGRLHGVEWGLVGVVTAGAIVQIAESAMFGTGQAYPYVFWLAVAGALVVYTPGSTVAARNGGRAILSGETRPAVLGRA
jgi:O-antigen ligase